MTLELQEILFRGNVASLCSPILEDAFSFEICEVDREIAVNLCKIFSIEINFCSPNMLHIDTKQVKRNLAILNGNQ